MDDLISRQDAIDKELIGNLRNMLKPFISLWLLKTNYEGMGEQDKEEFERDFDEILDLALIGLEYKAQLSQERSTSDTTYRQMAINAIENIDCSDGVGISALKCEGVDDVVMAIKDLPSAQPEPQWIPCSERLPKDDKCVLITCKWDDVEIGWYNGEWNCEYCVYDDGDIIAWMPMPEPYEGGEG